MHRKLVVAFVAALVLFSSSAVADSGSLVALRYVAFDGEQPSDLFNLRYSQRYGKLVLETEYLHQSRDNDSSFQQGEIGLGWRLGSKTLGLIPLLSVAIDDQERSWIVPTVWVVGSARWWEVTVRARQFVSLQDETPSKTLIKPLRVAFKPMNWLSIGLSVTVVHPEHKPWRRQSGPSIGFKVGKTSVYFQRYNGQESELLCSVRF